MAVYTGYEKPDKSTVEEIVRKKPTNLWLPITIHIVLQPLESASVTITCALVDRATDIQNGSLVRADDTRVLSLRGADLETWWNFADPQFRDKMDSMNADALKRLGVIPNDAVKSQQPVRDFDEAARKRR